MARTTTPTAHDWLSLVQLSGLLVSEPVLLTTFPDGPERVKPPAYRRLSKEYERFRAHHDLNRWVDFVLEELLEQPRPHWRKSHELPAGVVVSLLEYSQELRPSRVLVDEQARPLLLILVAPASQHLDRPETVTGRWKAAPMTKLDRLLRESSVPLGLLTNGETWRLVYTGLPTTAHLTWEAAGWRDEKGTLDGFFTLLNGRRFDAAADDNLDRLTAVSQTRQLDVADQLGQQVRTAVSHFIAALDQADRDSGDTILAGMPLDALYEMALALVMRLVFVLYAEENQLLPHGELLYDQGYGLTHLVNQLERARQADPAALAHAYDAWPQLLALFRLIFFGCPHPDLNLRDYGGDLFDPARYANPAGQPVLEHPALRLSNETVYQMARQLAYAYGRIGRERVRQRISYRTLDIEQIGYVYEGLLDHKVARAGEQLLLRFIGKPEAVVALAELESRAGDALVAYLAELTEKKPEQIVRLLVEEELSIVNGQWSMVNEAERARVARFAALLADDGLILPDRLYITTGQSRRATGTHYTPQSLTGPIVRHTLEPLLYKGIGAKPDNVTFGDGPLISAREILSLKVCDMAMGSGAFLVQACRYLAERLVEAWETAELRISDFGLRISEGPSAIQNPKSEIRITPYGEPSQGLPDEQILPPEREARLALARRLVAERCLYGVDKNPLAVEMARLSLWLATLSKERPFTFLNHALKSGDSLVGIGDVTQFTGWALDGRGTQGPILEQLVARDVQRALAARRELARLSSDDAASLARKQALLNEADAALARVRLGCDLLVGTYLGADGSKEQKLNRSELLTLYTSDATIDLAGAHKALAGTAVAAARSVRPFHWPFEFPEVFLDGGRGGFDAFVGNPPFLGGKRISNTFGDSYKNAIAVNIPGSNHNADLSAKFHLRCFRLLKRNGSYGLISTDRIAEGDTKAGGLDQILQLGGTIFKAETSQEWPGDASVRYALVLVFVGEKKEPFILNNLLVRQIYSNLSDFDIHSQEPKQLEQTWGTSYVGCAIQGVGFVLEREEAEHIRISNPKNEAVIRPFLTGNDLNHVPDYFPQRWIINFDDRSFEEASIFQEPMKIVKNRVKPYRDTVKRKAHREKWWQFGDRRPGLVNACKLHGQVIACVMTTVEFKFAWVPTDWVFDQTVVIVIPYQYLRQITKD